ncbi:hypothetical protein QBC34DRAFT_460682 [Podospora aff. communis PSN243]|uniref:Uncharacterized protein n=1 Tax=Podospora aff. communis PSN243 TaxID=3040156 RepID=A0AAV9H5X6_9PEZI|nr:hypothetical protein QBC34DRAFT_460682 [Podospora aff. communis PSN243]
MSLFVEAGLRKLIGVRGPSAGIRVTRRDKSPSLIEIAPAVWNIRYLQLLTAHARVIPAIAEGIARLSTSRSPTLREKVARLRGSRIGEVIAANRHGSSKDVEIGAESRLWTLCQSTIHAEPIAKSDARRDQDSAQNDSWSIGESNDLQSYERHYFETLGSQDGHFEHGANLDYYDREHNSFLDYLNYEIEEPELVGSADLEPYYGFMEERSNGEFAPGEVYLLERYDELPERYHQQRRAIHHGPFVTPPELSPRGEISRHPGLGYGQGTVGSSAVRYHVDSLVDEDVALPSALADGVDGSSESEGDYYYVDGQGNCFHIENPSFEEEESAWDGRPSVSGPIENQSAISRHEQ